MPKQEEPSETEVDNGGDGVHGTSTAADVEDQADEEIENLDILEAARDDLLKRIEDRLEILGAESMPINDLALMAGFVESSAWLFNNLKDTALRKIQDRVGLVATMFSCIQGVLCISEIPPWYKSCWSNTSTCCCFLTDKAYTFLATFFAALLGGAVAIIIYHETAPQCPTPWPTAFPSLSPTVPPTPAPSAVPTLLPTIPVPTTEPIPKNDVCDGAEPIKLSADGGIVVIRGSTNGAFPDPNVIDCSGTELPPKQSTRGVWYTIDAPSSLVLWIQVCMVGNNTAPFVYGYGGVCGKLVCLSDDATNSPGPCGGIGSFLAIRSSADVGGPYFLLVSEGFAEEDIGGDFLLSVRGLPPPIRE